MSESGGDKGESWTTGVGVLRFLEIGNIGLNENKLLR